MLWQLKYHRKLTVIQLFDSPASNLTAARTDHLDFSPLSFNQLFQLTISLKSTKCKKRAATLPIVPSTLSSLKKKKPPWTPRVILKLLPQIFPQFSFQESSLRARSRAFSRNAVPGNTWRNSTTHRVYVYRASLAELAGGPHYVSFPTAQPSYLFNVSFALVTIQIGPSFSMRCQPPSTNLTRVLLNY